MKDTKKSWKLTKIIDDGRINDGKPTETLEEAQRYR